MNLYYWELVNEMHFKQPKVAFGIISLFIAIVLFLLIYLPTRWMWYWPWLIAMSILTFCFYGFDKMQAKSDGARVPEIILHLLSLFGGFIGGWMGRGIFRHKTLHTTFLFVLSLSTVLHIVIILWILI